MLGVINGSPRPDIYDGNGKRRAVLGATLDSSPRLELYNPEGERRARLGIHANMARSRNVYLVRKGRGLGIAKEIKDNVEAAGGFEPPHRGFADLSLNHLGTPPFSET